MGATTGVPMDEHAQGLLKLGPQKWFLPVKAIARAAGFEGDSAVQQYRQWVGKLRRDPAVPEDVAEYNVYPADYEEKYYISGASKVKSSKELGIDFSLADQWHIIDILQQEDNHAAVEFGMGYTKSTSVEDQHRWSSLIVPLCAGYAHVFNLNEMSFIGRKDKIFALCRNFL